MTAQKNETDEIEGLSWESPPVQRASDDIIALQQAIVETVERETRQIIADAEAEADSIRERAKAEARTERDEILRRAREEAETRESQAVSTARLEAQTIKLRQREQMLDRVFEQACERIPSVVDRVDYDEIARALLREAIDHLGGVDIVVKVDEHTRQALGIETLEELEEGLDIHLEYGPQLERGTGVVLETVDGHRRYDNRLERRLERQQEALRAAVHRILVGEDA